MNEKDKDFALTITETLMKMPSAAPFIEPVDPEEEWYTNYCKKVKRPMSFYQIKSKIETDKYEELDKWRRDINLIWENSKLYFGENSFIAQLAHDLEKKYKKIANPKEKLSPQEWCNEVSSIKDKIVSYITKNPASKINEYCEQILDQKEIPEMSKQEKEDLVAASAALSDTSDARAMFGIIHGMNPSIHAISEDVKLDIRTISPRSLKMLELYVKTRFAEEGLKYPR